MWLLFFHYTIRLKVVMVSLGQYSRLKCPTYESNTKTTTVEVYELWKNGKVKRDPRCLLRRSGRVVLISFVCQRVTGQKLKMGDPLTDVLKNLIPSYSSFWCVLVINGYGVEVECRRDLIPTKRFETGRNEKPSMELHSHRCIRSH